VCAAVLPLAGWNAIAYVGSSFVDITACCSRLRANTTKLLIGGVLNASNLLTLEEVFAFVEIILSAHPALSLGPSIVCDNRTTTIGSPCCWASSIRSGPSIIKVVEVVEHEVHVLLLLTLEMVNDALVFVHLDADVGVSLS